MRFVLPILLLGLSALGARADASADMGRARRLASDLRSRFLEEREAAKRGLIDLGPGVESVVRELVDDPDARVRSAAVEVLGRIGTPSAVEAVLDVLARDGDAEVRTRAVESLVAVGADARKGLDRRIAQDPEHAEAYDAALEAFVCADVEGVLSGLITERYSYGFYSGQFSAIEKLGKPAVKVLFSMFTQPTYPFGMRDPKRRHIIRQLAGEALADMNDRSLVPALEEIYRRETAAAEMAFEQQDMEDTMAYVLFKLGRPQHMQDMAHRLESYLEGSREGQADLRPRLTGLLVRMGEYQRAESRYREIISDDPLRADWAYYNLACLYSIQSKIPEAIRHLREAVDQGFGDVDWIKQDGDLRNLHGNPEYEQIIRDLETRNRVKKPR